MEPQEIVNQAHTFYTDSWNSLLTLLGFGIAIIGVMVPILTNYFQRVSFENLVDKKMRLLTNEFDKRLLKEIDKLKWQNTIDLEDSTEETKRDLYNSLGSTMILLSTNEVNVKQMFAYAEIALILSVKTNKLSLQEDAIRLFNLNPSFDEILKKDKSGFLDMLEPLETKTRTIQEFIDKLENMKD